MRIQYPKPAPAGLNQNHVNMNNLINYPNIQKLDELYKIKDGLWYASGQKNGYNTSAMGGTRKQALETLELHLSYVAD
jgi:hypothetical protein